MKIVYVMDSRVSNTPVELGKEIQEELDRRICTIGEDYCIITSEPVGFEKAEMIRKNMAIALRDGYRLVKREKKSLIKGKPKK